MERLVGLALSRYLATYIKDFSSSQFKNWTLHDLEFKEDVVQSLAGIPPNFELKKVTCNQIYTKIPSISMLGSEPIVLVADTVYIELEEPQVIKKSAPAAPAPAVAAPVPKQSQGLMDRIIDNIKFEVKELRIKVTLLGKENSVKPTFNLVVQDIEIKSTNSRFEVVDLREVHTVDKSGHVIMHKEIDIGRFTFSVLFGDKTISLLDQLPIRVRTRTKKAYFRGPTINHGIQLDVLQSMDLHLHQQQFKALQDALDALFECMGRSAPVDTTPSSDSTPSFPTVAPTQLPVPAPEPEKAAQNGGSLWGRFASVIGSYAGYGAATSDTASTSSTSTTPTTPPPQQQSTPLPPEGNPDVEDSSRASPDDDDSDEEYRDAESDVSPTDLADKTSKAVTNDDDVTHTSYTICVGSGKISMYDFITEEKGIAELFYSGLRCEFIPKITAVRPKLCIDQAPPLSQENELVQQFKISIAVGNYGMNQLDPGPNRHPDFHYLLKRVVDENPSSASNGTSTLASDRPSLTLDYYKFPDWSNPNVVRKEANLTIDRVSIVADLRPWERLWIFFFGGQKGEKFAQYMQDNLGHMLEAALTEQVHFKFDLRQPTIVLPPYASRFVGKPHLASKVLFLNTRGLTVKSVPVEARLHEEFDRGLFRAKEFPALPHIDFSDADTAAVASLDVAESSSGAKFKYPKKYDDRDPLVVTERKFEFSVSDMSIDIQADPSARLQRILQPFDMTAHLIRREFQLKVSADSPIHLPVWTPQLEGFVSLSQVSVAFSPAQYSFFLGMFSERLDWNPSNVTDQIQKAQEAREAKTRPKPILGAAREAAAAAPVSANDAPLLMRVRLFVPSVNMKLLELAECIDYKRTAKAEPAKEDIHDANDSPSSTIHYDVDASSMVDHDDLESSRNVVLAEMGFNKLSYILESHGERNVTKVSASNFIVTSPVHADSPFSTLVSQISPDSSIASSPRMEEKPALLVRMEKLKKELPSPSPAKPLLDSNTTDKHISDSQAAVDPNDAYLVPREVNKSVMNVRLHGIQVCWIYTTLSQVQVFFTRGEEVPVELRNAQNIPYYNVPALASSAPVSTSSTAAAAAPSTGMDWAIIATQTELVVIETPDTPECMPMGLAEARFERRGVTLDETQYDFNGKCSFFSEMWDKELGTTRTPLTTPFNLDVAYASSRNKQTNNNSTNLEMLIDDLQVTFNRKQLIMVQNILDNQMADIRDVSSKREVEKEKDKQQQELLASSASIGHVAPVASVSASSLHASSSSLSGSPSGSLKLPEGPMKLNMPRVSAPPRSGTPSRSRDTPSSRDSPSSSIRIEDDFNPRKSEESDFNPRASNKWQAAAPKQQTRPSLLLNSDAYRSDSSSSAPGSTSSAHGMPPPGGFIPDTLIRALRNRFQIGVQKLTLKLLDAHDKPFAAIRLDDFLYSTENWSDVSVMLIEGGALMINSMAENSNHDSKISPYATILQPRLQTSIGGNEDVVSATHAPQLVPVLESFMPIISEATGPGLPSRLQAKLARDLKTTTTTTPTRSSSAGLQRNVQELDTISADLPLESTDLFIPPRAADKSQPLPSYKSGISQESLYNGTIPSSPMLSNFVMLGGSVPASAMAGRDPRNSSSTHYTPGPSKKPRFRGIRDDDDIVGILPTSPTGSMRYDGEEGDYDELSSAPSSKNVTPMVTPIKPTQSSTRNISIRKSGNAIDRDPSAQFSRSLHSSIAPKFMLNDEEPGPPASSGRPSITSRRNTVDTDEPRRTPHSSRKVLAPASSKKLKPSKKNSLWTDDETGSDDEDEQATQQSMDPVVLTDGRMFSLKFENVQPDFKGERQEKHAKWMSRWVIGFAPFDIVYDSKAFAQLQDFFALMAEHKNLRHRYQSFQAEVLKVYREQGGILNQAGLEQIQEASIANYQSPGGSPTPQASPDTAKRVALNIHIAGPRVSIPQPLEEESKAQGKTLLSVLEFSLENVRVVNAANASTKNDHRQQTKILMNGARVFMKTVQLGGEDELAVPSSEVAPKEPFEHAASSSNSMDPAPSSPQLPHHVEDSSSKVLGALTMQTQELVRPLTAKIVIEMKPVAAGGRPFMHVSIDVDMLAAMISIKRYQLLVGLVNNYILSFFKRERKAEHAADVGVAPEYYSAFLGSNNPQEQDVEVEKIIEVDVKTVNLTVISDYMAELELAYLHLTDFNGTVSIEPGVTDVTLAGRLEVLINNLNYMMPERLLDEFNWIVHLRTEKNLSTKPRTEPKAVRKGYAHEAMEDLNNLRTSMALTHRRQLSSGIVPPSSPSPQPHVPIDDPSMQLENDDAIVDIDLDPDTEPLESRKTGSEDDATTTTLDIAILDQLKFTLNKDLMRHLVELYQLSAMVQQDTKGDASLLHFQYLLVNRTESAIRYWQTNTDDAKVLKPGEETYFTFSNPYQLRRLEMRLEGWTHTEQAFSPEEVGSIRLRMQQTVTSDEEPSQRDIIVSVQPKGLKRYVEFLSTHQVVNDTDKILVLRTINASSGSEATTEYVIAPHMTVPIACSDNWQMKFSTSFGDVSWDFSKPLPITTQRPASLTDTLRLFSRSSQEERWLLCTTTAEKYEALENVWMVTLHFAAPVVIDNICVFPIEYYFPSMLPRRPRAVPQRNTRGAFSSYHDDEDELANSIAAVLPAQSTSYFYFDTMRHRELCCRLVGYSMWSGRIQIERVQQSSLELYKSADEAMEGEKDDILISVFIYARHHDLARRLAFNTQYLFVNDTDMLLFVRQQNTIPVSQILPRQMTPFSWVRGSSKMLSVNVGNTAWSPPVDIATDSYQRLDIKVPTFDVSYMFLMETHTLDDFSRIVCWRAWFHIRNHSSYDLKVYLKGSQHKHPDDYTDLPSFDIDQNDDDLVRKRSRPMKAPPNGKGGKLASEKQSLLVNGDDGDEEEALTIEPPGSIGRDMEAPTMRNTVFGNVSVSDEGWVVIPKHSNTTSGLCPNILGVSLARDSSPDPHNKDGEEHAPANDHGELWSAIEVPLTEQIAYSVPFHSLLDPKVFRALDISVTTDEKGLYITLTDNKDPPYIITNDTPFAMRLRRQPKKKADSDSSASKDSSATATPILSPRMPILQDHSTEDYVIEPNSKLNLFVPSVEDDFEYRASIIPPDEHAAKHGAQTGRHTRNPSGGNTAGLGISSGTQSLLSPMARTHRRVPSGLSGGGSGSQLSLAPIRDDDEDNLESAMDGEMSDVEDKGDFPDEDHVAAPSNASNSPAKKGRHKKQQGSGNQLLPPSTMTPPVKSSTPPLPLLASTSTSSGGKGSGEIRKPSIPAIQLPSTGSDPALKRGHSRHPSSGGNFVAATGLLSPRAAAQEAMDAFSSAIAATIDPRSGLQDSPTNNGPSISVSQTSLGASIRDSKLVKQYKQFFGDRMETWSQPFTLRSALDFSIDWSDRTSRSASSSLDDERNTIVGEFARRLNSSTGSNISAGDFYDMTPNTLLAHAQPQGKTRVITLSLPPIEEPDLASEDSDEEVVRRVMKVDFLIPEVQVWIYDSERDPIALVRLQKTQLEVSQYSNMQHSIFFVIQNAEANTLSPMAEYPVLFGVDSRALHGAHPRFLEFLVEWNVRDERTFIDYIGLRILPFVLQIDSEIIDSIPNLQEVFAPIAGSSDEGANKTEEGLDESASKAVNAKRPPAHLGGELVSMNGSGSNVYLSSSSMDYADAPADHFSILDAAVPGRLGLGDSGNFGGGHFYSGAADRELTDNNPGAPRNRRKIANMLAKHTEIQIYEFQEQKEIVQDNYLYVGRLEIYRLRVTVSIGTNTKHWPVIAEAQMQLPAFSRTDLSESIGALFSTLGTAYSNLVWAEIYQIVGNLDAIASPLQNLRKLTKGVTDFVKMPLEGLVLDDTPGAYLVGLWYGSVSFLLNFTDFMLTVMMKSFQSVSWVTQVLCLDEDFQRTKDLVSKQHPTNVAYGLGQGIREFGRGIFEGLAGFVLLPMRGGTRNGFPGAAAGFGKAFLGLPLKPIGGVFDLFSKTFEGLLQTMGRGYLLQERAEALALARQQIPEADIREKIQKFIAARDQRVLILDDARFMRHGRPLERYLVLTSHALYIINANKLHFDDYSPKKIPIGIIHDLTVPVTPETQMVVRLHPGQQLWHQDQFLFIVPDRKHFIIKMAARFGIKTMEVAKLEKLI